MILDGKGYIELDDAHIEGAGAVGVWTKADSVMGMPERLRACGRAHAVLPRLVPGACRCR